jgi:hypothetical protein
MKMTIEVDCTPEEARRVMGLPDVSSLNDHMVRELQSKISQNMSVLSADEMMKTWMAFGQGAQDQFRKLMEVSLKSVKNPE